MAGKALTAVIHHPQEADDPLPKGPMSGDIDGEACVRGISRRAVDELVEVTGMTGIPERRFSRLYAEIDGKIAPSWSGPSRATRPCIRLDATCVGLRQDGRIVSVAATIAGDANTAGRREVPGMAIGFSEAGTSGIGFLRKLVRRGLRGVELVVSDAHEGLRAAVAWSSGPAIRAIDPRDLGRMVRWQAGWRMKWFRAPGSAAFPRLGCGVTRPRARCRTGAG